MARPDITIVGLGPAGLDLVDPANLGLLLDPSVRVLVRTTRHPAAHELTAQRVVESGDDLYEVCDTFEEVYGQLASRVVEAAAAGRVVFAVPGSPNVGEFTVPLIRSLADEAGLSVEMRGGPSFVDAMCADLGIDPLADGLQILDGRDLPDPIWLGVPTIIAQVDLPIVLGDVLERLSRVMPPGAPISVVIDAGGVDARVIRGTPESIDPQLAGLRTSLFVEGGGGLAGVIGAMRRLRRECPWDREQTHHSIVSNLIEEAHELADALSALSATAPSAADVGDGAYGEVEDELGDVLLQVLFHITMGEEIGALRFDDVAETLRLKLVRRHPHVFGEREAGTAAEVRRIWEEVKTEEQATQHGIASLMDGVSAGLPSLVRADKLQGRAASAGFDWATPAEVADKVREELDELAVAVAAGDPAAVEEELGDVLLAVVNLARHTHADAEAALRRAAGKFEHRFRAMEASGSLAGLSLDELEARWQRAKADE